MYLSKNLRYLRENSKDKLSQEMLGKFVGASRSAISSYEDGRAEPKLEVLRAIADFFRVSVDHLLNQDLVLLGNQELQYREAEKEYMSGAAMRVLTVAVDGQNNEQIQLVPEKAAAGYAIGYADKEYISELPTYRLPFLSKGRTYRAFEITGDSMLPILPHSIVVGEFVENWNDLKDGQVCIVVSRHDGVVLKKVYNRAAERNVFLLKSTNINYEPYEIKVADVLEIWKFAAYLSKEAPDESHGTSVHDLKQAYWRLDEQMRAISSRFSDL